MFHGLAQAEVRGEGERSEQLRKADTGVALVHVLSLGTNQPRGYGAEGVGGDPGAVKAGGLCAGTEHPGHDVARNRLRG
jgi:hypothetical protein